MEKSDFTNFLFFQSRKFSIFTDHNLMRMEHVHLNYIVEKVWTNETKDRN